MAWTNISRFNRTLTGGKRPYRRPADGLVRSETTVELAADGFTGELRWRIEKG
ncbi:MAG: hypothetical protein QF387_06395 [Arenicellales bacterium]|nr:hypothetical protein [Arenicellales bacterium]